MRAYHVIRFKLISGLADLPKGSVYNIEKNCLNPGKICVDGFQTHSFPKRNGRYKEVCINEANGGFIILFYFGLEDQRITLLMKPNMCLSN